MIPATTRARRGQPTIQAVSPLALQGYGGRLWERKVRLREGPGLPLSWARGRREHANAHTHDDQSHHLFRVVYANRT